MEKENEQKLNEAEEKAFNDLCRHSGIKVEAGEADPPEESAEEKKDSELADEIYLSGHAGDPDGELSKEDEEIVDQLLGKSSAPNEII